MQTPEHHQAVLFDLDGTLLDTLRDIAESGNRVLEGMGLPIHPIDRYRTMVGDGVEVLARRILPEDRRDPATIAAAAAAYRTDYGKSWDVHAAAYDGVDELLCTLAGSGIRTAVLSNKPHPFTLQCVERFLSGHTFDVVLGASGRFPHKPDPAAALHIAETLNLPAAQLLYVGDTDTDMKTAVAAGMFPVGALWGFRERDELVSHGARALAEKPTDVLQWL